MGRRSGLRPRAPGAGKGCGRPPSLGGLGRRGVTPHAAPEDGPVGGAAGARYREAGAKGMAARQRVRRRREGKGYGLSRRRRKETGEGIGRIETTGGPARARPAGHGKAGTQAHVSAAAFDLVRMRPPAAAA